MHAFHRCEKQMHTSSDGDRKSQILGNLAVLADMTWVLHMSVEET